MRRPRLMVECQRLPSPTDEINHQHIEEDAVDREIIQPLGTESRLRDRGYAPGLRAGPFLFISGQLGRTRDYQMILDTEEQFLAAFESVRAILVAAGCDFEDVVDLTTFRVDLPKHDAHFRAVKQRIVSLRNCAWTMIGVAALAYPGAVVEIKAIALVPGK
jgi:enamine deaminase RidA (YjgF/YER057c/UK114 family)